MRRSLNLAQLSLIALARANPVWQSLRSRQTGQHAKIVWGPCDNYTFTAPLECGSYEVPLDYTDVTVGTLDLELVRLRSSSDQPQGTIFVNFGGPGSDGRDALNYLGPIMQSTTGGCYDMINITPRGTNNTLFFDCYGDPEARAAVETSPSGNSSDTARDQTWADATLRSTTCAARQNATGRYVGTAFVARDHHAVAEALGEADTFRFWGISYGTILGATYAAMFPDTIDKMMLDGTANAHEYYRNEETELFVDSDTVFEQMLTECAHNPDVCILAKDRTAPELIDHTWTFLDNLKVNPAPLVLPNGDGFSVSYSTIRTYLQTALYSPGNWPSITSMFQAVADRNATAALSYMNSQEGSTQAEAQFGIKCGDVWTPQNDEEAVRQVLIGRAAASRAIGDTADIVPTTCGQWTMPAKEQYRGDFRVNTSKPILFIGNTGDPVTPIVGARNMSLGFNGSVVLEHGGFGHGIGATQASRCTIDAVRAYFADGTLPAPGAVCEIEDVEFGTTGWADLLEKMPARCPAPLVYGVE